MHLAVKVIDRESSGIGETEFELQLVSETVTIGELIAERVRDEVRKLVENPEGYVVRMLKSAGDRKSSSDGMCKGRLPGIDPERQVRAAIESFNQGEFFLFIDDRQYIDVNEKVSLTRHSTVEFIRLIPLVGG